MTVLRAIEAAGGFTRRANQKKVQIVHPNGSKTVVNCIEARKNPKLDLEIHKDDRILVPR